MKVFLLKHRNGELNCHCYEKMDISIGIVPIQQ